MNGRRRTSRRSVWLACAAALGAAWVVSPDVASAGQFTLTVGSNPRGVRVPPVYETRKRVVTIPAVYEERPRRIWREPVYETRRVLVEVPAKVVTRRVARHGRHGTIVGHRMVTRVIEPARRVWRTERVLVRPGFYETVYERVCVVPASTKVVHERVLVQPRHRALPRAVRVHHGPRHERLVPLRPRHRHRHDALRVALHLGR